MQISTILKAIVAPLEDRSDQSLPRMQVGDQLTGKVLRLEADGRLLVDLGTFRAFAHSAVAVRPGETLQLEVIKAGVPLYLKTVTPQSGKAEAPLPRMEFHQVLDFTGQQRLSAIFNRLTTAMTAPAADRSVPSIVQNAMAQITSIFEPMPLSRTPDQIAQWLITTLEDSGLFLEKKLADAVILGEGEKPGDKSTAPTTPVFEPRDVSNAGATALSHSIGKDLKARLLIMRHFINSEPGNRFLEDVVSGKESRFLREAVQKLITHVEGQQERVVQRSGEGDAYQVVDHWLPVDDQDKPLRVKVYYPKKKMSHQGLHPKVALLLDMDRLGLIRVDVSMIERALSIEFFVQNENVKEVVETDIAQVDEALKGFFDQVTIQVRLSLEKIASFESEDMATGAMGRIDIQA